MNTHQTVRRVICRFLSLRFFTAISSLRSITATANNTQCVTRTRDGGVVWAFNCRKLPKGFFLLLKIYDRRLKPTAVSSRTTQRIIYVLVCIHMYIYMYSSTNKYVYINDCGMCVCVCVSDEDHNKSAEKGLQTLGDVHIRTYVCDKGFKRKLCCSSQFFCVCFTNTSYKKIKVTKWVCLENVSRGQ